MRGQGISHDPDLDRQILSSLLTSAVGTKGIVNTFLLRMALHYWQWIMMMTIDPDFVMVSSVGIRSQYNKEREHSIYCAQCNIYIEGVNLLSILKLELYRALQTSCFFVTFLFRVEYLLFMIKWKQLNWLLVWIERVL